MNPGDKVCYIPTQENGIVKSTHMQSIGIVHVAYNCTEENYRERMAQITETTYLREGWISESDYKNS